MTIGMWALPILIGVLLAPESPWWLVRHGKYDQARASLLRLTRRGHHYNAEDAMMMMKRTNEVEEYLSAGALKVSIFVAQR